MMILARTLRLSSLFFVLSILALVSLIGCHGDGHEHGHADDLAHGHTNSDSDNGHANIEVLKITNLLRSSLALADSVEIIVSHLEVPPGTTLPAHYHPGEEFVYFLEGSGELYIDDQTIVLKGGDLYKIPLEKVHSFSTLEDQAKAVVFRVHKEGQPDRILVK